MYTEITLQPIAHYYRNLTKSKSYISSSWTGFTEIMHWEVHNSVLTRLHLMKIVSLLENDEKLFFEFFLVSWNLGYTFPDTLVDMHTNYSSKVEYVQTSSRNAGSCYSCIPVNRVGNSICLFASCWVATGPSSRVVVHEGNKNANKPSQRGNKKWTQDSSCYATFIYRKFFHLLVESTNGISLLGIRFL